MITQKQVHFYEKNRCLDVSKLIYNIFVENQSPLCLIVIIFFIHPETAYVMLLYVGLYYKLLLVFYNFCNLIS